MSVSPLRFAALPIGSVMASVDDSGQSTISLRGEHDVANLAELSRALGQGIAWGRDALVVEMSGVEFLSAASIGALVSARHLLQSQSRDLVLRSPSERAVRVLGLCGLVGLIDPVERTKSAHLAEALATWVSVPRASPFPTSPS